MRLGEPMHASAEYPKSLRIMIEFLEKSVRILCARRRPQHTMMKACHMH
jgi:hypothetical protein